jgi:catechol 2,3-dioxygenase-like lactoylglutathione lyase family enzyme
MRARGFTHTSINADDAEVSARFYEELFGLERIPAPWFGFPVVWLRLGDLQLHLFQREGCTAPSNHHIGIDVDDFDGYLAKAQAMGVVDEATISAARVLPSGEVQSYIRDPAGNLVEVNCPDVTTLAPETQARLRRLEDDFPQTGANLVARIYLEPEAAPASFAR